jgi:molybdopterin synthase sulfur carrier subunit
MAHVVFTQNLQRHLPCPAVTVPGDTVRAALDRVFAQSPRLRGYILDDQSRLRRHVAVYVDGRPLTDRAGLGDAVGAESRIHVMQALSGG